MTGFLSPCRSPGSGLVHFCPKFPSTRSASPCHAPALPAHPVGCLSVGLGVPAVAHNNQQVLQAADTQQKSGGNATPPFGGMSTPKAASGAQATAPGPCMEEQVEAMPDRRLHFSRAASLVRCAPWAGTRGSPCLSSLVHPAGYRALVATPANPPGRVGRRQHFCRSACRHLRLLPPPVSHLSHVNRCLQHLHAVIRILDLLPVPASRYRCGSRIL